MNQLDLITTVLFLLLASRSSWVLIVTGAAYYELEFKLTGRRISYLRTVLNLNVNSPADMFSMEDYKKISNPLKRFTYLKFWGMYFLDFNTLCKTFPFVTFFITYELTLLLFLIIGLNLLYHWMLMLLAIIYIFILYISK